VEIVERSASTSTSARSKQRGAEEYSLPAADDDNEEFGLEDGDGMEWTD
jgi:hypothetical protein